MIEHTRNKHKDFPGSVHWVGRFDAPRPAPGRAPLRGALILAIAAALAGCNASSGVDLGSQGGPNNTAGRFVVNENPYNPISYGQTSGFYHGGR